MSFSTVVAQARNTFTFGKQGKSLSEITSAFRTMQEELATLVSNNTVAKEEKEQEARKLLNEAEQISQETTKAQAIMGKLADFI